MESFKKYTGAWIISGIVLLFIGIYFIMKVNAQNKHNTMKNAAVAQVEVRDANFDKMFKTIAQIAQVPEKAKDAFREIYTPLIEGRYSNDDQVMFKFIKEQNPQFDFSLYKDVSIAIESGRNEFFLEQKKMVSMATAHKTYIRNWPASMFIDPNDTVAYKLVTSTYTQQVGRQCHQDHCGSLEGCSVAEGTGSGLSARRLPRECQ